jgi:predicted flavoprotein YhiN
VALAEKAKNYELEVTGTKGFANAQVTSGGVSVGEINPKTMESKLCKGLFFAGEIIDVDAPCGGYNLQWAFASGLLAGENI